jgi:hypothetical protein
MPPPAEVGNASSSSSSAPIRGEQLLAVAAPWTLRKCAGELTDKALQNPRLPDTLSRVVQGKLPTALTHSFCRQVLENPVNWRKVLQADPTLPKHPGTLLQGLLLDNVRAPVATLALGQSPGRGLATAVGLGVFAYSVGGQLSQALDNLRRQRQATPLDTTATSIKAVGTTAGILGRSVATWEAANVGYVVGDSLAHGLGMTKLGMAAGIGMGSAAALLTRGSLGAIEQALRQRLTPADAQGHPVA